MVAVHHDLRDLAGLLALMAVPVPSQFLLLTAGPILAAAVVATAYSFVVYRRVVPE